VADPSSNKPLVASVVLNWNRKDDALSCLDSLRSQRVDGWRHEVILVDNGSSDGTTEAVRALWPEIQVLALPENVGFAAGINRGIEAALDQGAEWTLLVNNDAVAPDGLLAELLRAARDPAVGFATPTIVYADDPSRVWPSAGTRRRLTLAPIDTTADPPSAEAYDVEWATACCLLVRSNVWRSVGLFDERYRFYYEDHDLSIRARSQGWRILHVPGPRVLHTVSASTGTGSPGNMYLLARASVPFFIRNTRGVQRIIIVPYRIGSLVRTVCRAVADGRPRSAWAYLVGLSHGIRDLFGGHPEGASWSDM